MVSTGQTIGVVRSTIAAARGARVSTMAISATTAIRAITAMFAVLGEKINYLTIIAVRNYRSGPSAHFYNFPSEI